MVDHTRSEIIVKIREGVKNILRGGKPFLFFLGGLESNSGILREGQSFLFIFKGGHEKIAKKCPEMSTVKMSNVNIIFA